MRKTMESKIEQLTDKKRVVTAENVSLRAKYDVVSKLEKEVYDKLMNQTEMNNQRVSTLNSEYSIKNKERNEIDALVRALEHEIKDGLETNKQIDFELQNSNKMEEMKQKDFENSLSLNDSLNKFKEDEYLDVEKRIKALNSLSSDDPIVKNEYEKNIEYKKKIDNLEKDLLMANFRVEELEICNEFLIKKKEEVIQERKKFLVLNDELKREIEQKSQLNEMRIQKKVKENNSEEIQKLQEDLKEKLEKCDELEKKVQVESDKSKAFTSEIIKLNIEIKQRETKKEKLMEILDEKYKQIDEFKEKDDELKDVFHVLNDKLIKFQADHEMLKNKNKLLTEEHSSLFSKLNYITNNYDISSNLKRISMEDLKLLTQTNSMVNDSINTFVNKVGTFKSSQLPKSFFDELKS